VGVEGSNGGVDGAYFQLVSFHIAERVIIQVWISTHFGVLSEQLPVADENLLFIKATCTIAPVPR
jgi:hypothetical protein